METAVVVVVAVVAVAAADVIVVVDSVGSAVVVDCVDAAVDCGDGVDSADVVVAGVVDSGGDVVVVVAAAVDAVVVDSKVELEDGSITYCRSGLSGRFPTDDALLHLEHPSPSSDRRSLH